MASYIIGSEIDIKRQQGDLSDVVVTMPDSISMSTYSTVKFQVQKLDGTVIIDKSTAASTITVASQTITIPILAADTKNYNGLFRWELEVSASASNVITVARGNFEITKELLL